MEPPMKIQIKRFGEILTSRPEGREAALILLANELKTATAKIELDFAGVLVLTPSWLGEFINVLTRPEIREFTYVHLENASVAASVQMTQEMPQAYKPHT
jgi:hypothetical protein